MRRTVAAAVCGLALLGCGRREDALAPVEGQVSHRGQPLAGGTVVFTPDPQRGGRGPQAVAAIGPDGHFRLHTADRPGAVAGWHRVTVAPARAAALPAHFRDPDLSGLTIEVRPGRPNRCDLRLD